MYDAETDTVASDRDEARGQQPYYGILANAGEGAIDHRERANPARTENRGSPDYRKRSLVYIAGPISRGNPFHNAHAACAVWLAFWEKAVYAICPHWSCLQDMVLPTAYEDFLAYDFGLIPHCAAIFRMPGESPGADRECAFAFGAGIPVYTDFDACVNYIRRLDDERV